MREQQLNSFLASTSLAGETGSSLVKSGQLNGRFCLHLLSFDLLLSVCFSVAVRKRLPSRLQTTASQPFNKLCFLRLFLCYFIIDDMYSNTGPFLLGTTPNTSVPAAMEAHSSQQRGFAVPR